MEEPLIIPSSDSYKVERGVVSNWEGFEETLHHLYSDQLKINAGEYPVLVGEPPLNAKINRERIAEILFEVFNVPASYVAISSILALFSAGRTTGVVVESGHGVTQIVPVYEGHTLPHAIQRINLGGGDLNTYLKNQLLGREDDAIAAIDDSSVVDIKHKNCFVSQDFEHDLATNTDEVTYALPDGQEVRINQERFVTPEAMFQPSSIDFLEMYEQQGIHACVMDVVAKCDLDIRRSMFENIIISGGNTMFPGFPERLKREVSSMVERGVRVGLVVPSNRSVAAWLGGAVFTSLPTIDDMWIYKHQYEEEGASIMSRACLSVTDRSGWMLQ